MANCFESKFSGINLLQKLIFNLLHVSRKRKFNHIKHELENKKLFSELPHTKSLSGTYNDITVFQGLLFTGSNASPVECYVIDGFKD